MMGLGKAGHAGPARLRCAATGTADPAGAGRRSVAGAGAGRRSVAGGDAGTGQTGTARLAAAAVLLAILAGCAAPGGGISLGTDAGQGPGTSNPLGGMMARLPAIGLGGAAAAPSAQPGAVVDPFAGQGVRQPDIPPAGGVKPAPASPAAAQPAAPSAAPAAGQASGGAVVPPATRPSDAAVSPGNRPSGAASSHVVQSGETAWSIARKYGVTIAALAAANNLPADTMTVRLGQKLVIPAGGAKAAEAGVSAPGTGSPTPEPPSASKPLPKETTPSAASPVSKPEAPDLGATRTKASGNGKFQMPVAGAIVRAYAKGQNDGIDLSAPTGTSVKAAGSGTVAAITRDTDGVPIVVIRHEGQLMTVYSGLDTLSVSKGDAVSAGKVIGKTGKAGVLHFEVRQGFESVDPETYLR